MMTDMTNDYNQPLSSSSNLNTYEYMTASANGSPCYQHDSSHTVETLVHQHSPQQSISSKSSHHPYCDSDPQSYCNYFYQFGFLQGNFSDITVRIPYLSKTFRLHSLVLSRSPYLYQRMTRLQTSVLDLEYESAAIEAYHLIFSHLYRPLTRHDMIRLAHTNPTIYSQLVGLADHMHLFNLKHALVQSVEFNDTMAIQWSEQHPFVKEMEDRWMAYLTRDLLPPVKNSSDLLMLGQHRVEVSLIWRFPDRLVALYAALPPAILHRCLATLADPLQRYHLATRVMARRQDGISPALHFDHSPGMTVTYLETPRCKLGKWDPSLHDTFYSS